MIVIPRSSVKEFDMLDLIDRPVEKIVEVDVASIHMGETVLIKISDYTTSTMNNISMRPERLLSAGFRGSRDLS